MYKIRDKATGKFICLYSLTANILPKTNSISDILSRYGELFTYKYTAKIVASKIKLHFPRSDLVVIKSQHKPNSIKKYNIFVRDDGKQCDNCVFDVVVVSYCVGEAKDRIIKHLKTTYDVDITEDMLTVLTETEEWVSEAVHVIECDFYN